MTLSSQCQPLSLHDSYAGTLHSAFSKHDIEELTSHKSTTTNSSPKIYSDIDVDSRMACWEYYFALTMKRCQVMLRARKEQGTGKRFILKSRVAISIDEVLVAIEAVEEATQVNKKKISTDRPWDRSRVCDCIRRSRWRFGVHGIWECRGRIVLKLRWTFFLVHFTIVYPSVVLLYDHADFRGLRQLAYCWSQIIPLFYSRHP